MRKTVARLLLLAAIAFVVLMSGCTGTSKGIQNSVSGKVTLNGDPVSGTVVFVGSDGKEAMSPISAEGKYDIPNPPQGTVKILVKGTGIIAPPKDGGLPAGTKDAPGAGTGGRFALSSAVLPVLGRAQARLRVPVF